MKRALSVFMFVLLLVSTLTLAFNIQPVKAEPKAWYVDDDGGADFTTINGALIPASDGDTIFVCNGTYHEIIINHKSLTFVGENKYATIIDGSGSPEFAVKLRAGTRAFTGFTIRNAGNGMVLEFARGVNISNNIILGAGVSLYSSNYNTIADNIICNATGAGIYHSWSSNNVESGNIISMNDQLPDRIAIYLGDECHDNIFFNNTISKSGLGIYAGTLAYRNTYDGNTISDPVSYECGINIWGPNNKIIGNTITNMGYVGIQLNSMSSDGGGVPNTCANNVVSGNTISNSTFGINLILAASSNAIVENNVSNNGLGILLSDQSDNNTIIGNLVSNNDYGILLFSSNNTKIYHNSFIENTQQVLLSESFNTAWDDGYPSGGNYWSDYVGVDMFRGPSQNETGSDGIGDTPYIVDPGNQDNYPLMAYGAGLRHVGDVNDDGRVDIIDIARVAAAFGSSRGQARYNPSCDFNFDGRVDVQDLAPTSGNFGWYE